MSPTYLERAQALRALSNQNAMFCEDIMEWLEDSQEDSHNEINRILLEASDSYETDATAQPPPPSNDEHAHVHGTSYASPFPVILC